MSIPDPATCDHKFVDSKHCLKCGWLPPVTSLSRLLRLVEQCQEQDKCNDDPGCPTCLLCDFNVPALRAAAQQHAEALRAVNKLEWSGGDEDLRAAADFLDPKEEA